MKITRIDLFRHRLGEGPVWDAREQALFGVDVLGRKLWRYDPARREYDTWPAEDLVSSLALRANGGAIVACRDRLKFFDFGTGTFCAMGEFVLQDARLQLNDGKTDAAGRFFVGGVNTEGRDAAASFYSVDPTQRVQLLDSDFIVSNGPCWSPDGRIFYCADTVRGEIYAYDYDVPSGSLSRRRRFADTRRLGGGPDGATVDERGSLWSALCGGSKVVRFSPDGDVLQTVELPTPLVSSVMFGGEHLDMLFVTTIDGAAAAAEIPLAAANPVPHDENSGALFIIEGLGVSGIPEQRFRG